MGDIDAIYVDQIGWVYSDQGKIECFEENGEMARVKWYKQTPYEQKSDVNLTNTFNGKYVIHIRYRKEK